MNSVPTGRRLGIDVGTVRVGLALSDPLGMLASPLTTVEFSQAKQAVVDLVTREDIGAIYVGWPLHLSGKAGASTEMVLSFLEEIAGQTVLPIRLIDERLTTSQAAKYRGSKNDVDSIAATLILERALNEESSLGSLAGKPYEKA